MKQFVNQATAHGWVGETPINATSNTWTVTMQPGCVCQELCECVTLRNLHYVEGCNVCHTNTRYMVVYGRPMVRVWYRICINYQDCRGRPRRFYRIGSTLFINLPPNFDSRNFAVEIPSPVCVDSSCCTVRIGFRVILCS